MSATDIIGTIATAIGFIVQLPQAYTIYKNKTTENVNLYTYILWLVGSTCWTIYGLRKADVILTVSSGFSTLIASVILIMYVIFEQRRRVSNLTASHHCPSESKDNTNDGENTGKDMVMQV